jgi:signal transduction histidine kinase/ActR/RegA family two-component response regulator
MPDQMRPRLGRLVVPPLAIFGALAAVLVWEVEHVGSAIIALALMFGGVAVGVFVARRVREQIDELSDHYAALIRTADEQSRRAEAANRLKDEFLATLSHELRTPLNAVLGWSRLLAGGSLDAEQTAKAVRAIERAGWAQSQLIENLLDISHIVAGRLEISTRPTHVQPLVDAAVRAQRPAAVAKRIALDVDLDPALGPIAADPDRLLQIVWNLIANAIKFTPAGGHVRVTLRATDREICLSVEDTGVGFDPAVAAHLFERFRQADGSSTRQYGGLGLGLAIVRHLVELHGGTVTASSAGMNRGSMFEVRFPLRKVAVTPQRADTAAFLRGVRVLAVDADPSQLEFVRATLEHYGAVVMTASSVDEACDRFTRESPDVVLSDLILADHDGFELIREIRALDEAHGRLTPAAALTRLARTDDRRRALSAGYQMHVAKPMDPYELAFAVQQLARAPGSGHHSHLTH